MKSYQEQRKWKYIIIHKGRENECKQFELDDSQRLIHKIQRQKKRSIKLAKIGFYENNKIAKIVTSFTFSLFNEIKYFTDTISPSAHAQ